jgi:hypothetical protein
MNDINEALWVFEHIKKLRPELERQVREELKTDSENPVRADIVNAVRQKFGLPVVLEHSNLKGKRYARN